MNHYELLLRHAHLRRSYADFRRRRATRPGWIYLNPAIASCSSYDWITVQAHGGENEKTVFALPQSAQLNAEKLFYFGQNPGAGFKPAGADCQQQKECWLLVPTTQAVKV